MKLLRGGRMGLTLLDNERRRSVSACMVRFLSVMACFS